MPNSEDQENAEQVKKFWIFSLNRQFSAYVLMTLFVLCTTVGVFLIYPPAGFIALGVTCGLYAYLLGSD